MQCLAPVLLPSGVLVDCRQCWRCRSNRIEDYVGRSIAESLTCIETHVVTLTYGRDDQDRKIHNKSAKLEYRDVQDFLKRLRWAGYPPRYLAAGEYGGDFGRAHWHVVLSWPIRVPDHPEYEKRHQPFRWFDRDGCERDFWPHGFTYWEKPNFKSLRYALKYALKDEENPNAENIFGFSSRPPLGDAYFRARARKLVEQHLAPQDAFYSFSNVVKKNGQLRKFRMRFKTLDNFMSQWVDSWREAYGKEDFPASPFLEKWLDSKERFYDFRRPVDRRPVLGFVSSFQPEGGAKQWLEKPEKVAPTKWGEKLPQRDQGPRIGESYRDWRLRTIREERALSSTATKSPENR